MVKFRGQQDPRDIGLAEYLCSLAARKAGVVMPKTRLFPSSRCQGCFAVKRFDRAHGMKIFMQTACGLLHAPHYYPSMDYEGLLRLTVKLTKNMKDIENFVRLMVFNVKIGNRDDHTKNFSFLLDRDCTWHFAPAYDLVPCQGINGEHWAMVNGKGKNITDADLIAVAAVGGVSARRVKQFIESTEDALAETCREYPEFRGCLSLAG